MLNMIQVEIHHKLKKLAKPTLDFDQLPEIPFKGSIAMQMIMQIIEKNLNKDVFRLWTSEASIQKCKIVRGGCRSERGSL